MTPPSRLLLSCCALLPVACRTVASQPIPDPPPEAAAWTVAERAGEGAYLGLATRENDSGTLDALFFEPGVRVDRVDPHSPADVAGLRVGDVVLSWDGTEVLEPESLEALERAASGGDVVRLEVQRDDTVFDVPVTLRARGGDDAGEAEVVARVDPVRSRARWRTVEGGVLLLASEDGAPFPAAGVPVGSVITELDGRPVVSAREFIRLLLAHEPGGDARVAWTDRDGARQETEVELLDVPREVTGFGIPILTHYDHDPQDDTTSFVLIDLYVISLFRYTRDGEEREWRFLRWFRTSTGVGALSE